MITRERLERTAYGQGLLALFDRLTPYNVTDWGNDDSQTKSENRPGDREEVAVLDDANVITSLWVNSEARHALVLDIDHPAWLIPSTTPGHYHLYVDVPNGMTNAEYNAVLDVLANARVIEAGYAGASKARGFTSCRLPWVAKDKTGPTQHD